MKSQKFELEDCDFFRHLCPKRAHQLFVLCSFFAEQTTEELKQQREEKKRYLLRKLSFRPSVDELKSRKVTI